MNSATPGSENPKDAAGRAKVPLHLWPASASAAGAVGLYEGMLKYGRNNFRTTGVAASVYVAAAKRHIDAWFEGGEDGHLGNALACLAILVDTATNGTMIDDRNYTPVGGAYDAFAAECARRMVDIQDQYGHHTPKHWDARDGVQPVAYEFKPDLDQGVFSQTIGGAWAQANRDWNEAQAQKSEFAEKLDKEASKAPSLKDVLGQWHPPAAKGPVPSNSEDSFIATLRDIFGPDVQIVKL